MYNHLPYVSSIHPSALEDTNENCCVHQLSIQLGVALDRAKDLMTEVQHDLYPEGIDGRRWDEVGCTGVMVFEFAKRLNASCYILYGHKMLLSHLGGKGAFAASIFGDHLYSIEGAGKMSVAHMQRKPLEVKRAEVFAQPTKRPSALDVWALEPYNGLRPGSSTPAVTRCKVFWRKWFLKNKSRKFRKSISQKSAN